ncbi:hypothetical protein Tco_0813661 [Tanacetum coccineum]
MVRSESSIFFTKIGLSFSNLHPQESHILLINPHLLLPPSIMAHPDDDDVDMNDEGTSRQSTLTLTSYRDSLPHLSPQNYLDPTKDEEHIPTMFHRQTTMMNRQVLMHME